MVVVGGVAIAGGRWGWELGKVVEDALDMLVVVLVFSDARCTGVMGVK